MTSVIIFFAVRRKKNENNNKRGEGSLPSWSHFCLNLEAPFTLPLLLPPHEPPLTRPFLKLPTLEAPMDIALLKLLTTHIFSRLKALMMEMNALSWKLL